MLQARDVFLSGFTPTTVMVTPWRLRDTLARTRKTPTPGKHWSLRSTPKTSPFFLLRSGLFLLHIPSIFAGFRSTSSLREVPSTGPLTKARALSLRLAIAVLHSCGICTIVDRHGSYPHGHKGILTCILVTLDGVARVEEACQNGKGCRAQRVYKEGC